MKPITITWKELYDLVAARDGLLATDSECGYMELEVPMDYNSDDPELWRNCAPEMEDREDLLCLHVYATCIGRLNYFTASVGKDYYIELPPDFMIAVESTGTIVVPYSFDNGGDPLDYLNLHIVDGRMLHPEREGGGLVLKADRDVAPQPETDGIMPMPLGEADEEDLAKGYLYVISAFTGVPYGELSREGSADAAAAAHHFPPLEEFERAVRTRADFHRIKVGMQMLKERYP